jgi:hypothetical protein
MQPLYGNRRVGVGEGCNLNFAAKRRRARNAFRQGKIMVAAANYPDRLAVLKRRCDANDVKSGENGE